MKSLMCVYILSVALQQGSGLAAPDFGLAGAPPVPVRSRQYVEYLDGQHKVAANKAALLTLRFHIADGFHINSHKPLSELQIPTSLRLEPVSGVKLRGESYPAGQPYKLADDTLDVYTGFVEVTLPVVAARGTHTLTGLLRYQACDRAACYPPKTLPLSVVVTAE